MYIHRQNIPIPASATSHISPTSTIPESATSPIPPKPPVSPIPASATSPIPLNINYLSFNMCPSNIYIFFVRNFLLFLIHLYRKIHHINDGIYIGVTVILDLICIILMLMVIKNILQYVTNGGIDEEIIIHCILSNTYKNKTVIIASIIQYIHY